MKKAALLLIVAAAVGIAAFIAIATYFAEKQIRTRINDFGNMVINVSGSTRTALDRNYWASIMPPTELDVPADEFVENSTFGRAEWFVKFGDLSAESGGRLVRVVEDFKILEPPTNARYAGLGPTLTTWTWFQGVPGEWGERMQMRAIWIYEQQEYKIALLAMEGRADTKDWPPANPK